MEPPYAQRGRLGRKSCIFGHAGAEVMECTVCWLVNRSTRHSRARRPGSPWCCVPKVVSSACKKEVQCCRLPYSAHDLILMLGMSHPVRSVWIQLSKAGHGVALGSDFV